MKYAYAFPILLFIGMLAPLTEKAQQKAVMSTALPHHDHAGMIRIPGGDFRPFLLLDKRQQKIKILPFYLDPHAVTNEEFLEFVKANPRWVRSRIPRVFADISYLKHWAGDLNIGDVRIKNSPVTNVSWFAANAYARWKGKHLPTMAQWEYAAGARPVNFKEGKDLCRIILGWYDHPMPTILPCVESTYKNDFGVYDMHGLVWEWVDDFNSIIIQSGAGARSPNVNAFYCGAGSQGTANKEDYAAYMRYAFRESLQATYTVGSLGFRCAKEINDPN